VFLTLPFNNSGRDVVVGAPPANVAVLTKEELEEIKVCKNKYRTKAL
jgi:hypothetical protein